MFILLVFYRNYPKFPSLGKKKVQIKKHNVLSYNVLSQNKLTDTIFWFIYLSSLELSPEMNSSPFKISQHVHSSGFLRNYQLHALIFLIILNSFLVYYQIFQNYFYSNSRITYAPKKSTPQRESIRFLIQSILHTHTQLKVGFVTPVFMNFYFEMSK